MSGKIDKTGVSESRKDEMLSAVFSPLVLGDGSSFAGRQFPSKRVLAPVSLMLEPYQASSPGLCDRKCAICQQPLAVLGVIFTKHLLGWFFIASMP